jgi:hypothetical protein
MRDIKRALDPHAILNPGKVLKREIDHVSESKHSPGDESVVIAYKLL